MMAKIYIVNKICEKKSVARSLFYCGEIKGSEKTVAKTCGEIMCGEIIVNRNPMAHQYRLCKIRLIINRFD